MKTARVKNRELTRHTRWSIGEVGNNFSTKLLEYFGRDFDLEAAAAATKDDPVRRHNSVIDVERQVGRQRERGYASDLHPGETVHLFGGRKRRPRNTHEARDALVHIEFGVPQNHTSDVLFGLLLRCDD